MPVALCAMSHSPLIGLNQPADDVVAAVDAAVDCARDFVRSFAPDLVVVFAPDHYNGFFYDRMPPFCIGTAATSVGDFGTVAAELSVDSAAAQRLAEGALAQDIDMTISARMQVDHGLVQPLDELFGGIDRVPVVPVFINSVATPLGPVRRIRALGAALGTTAVMLDRRVLFVGSGGLSHDPPVPVLAGAPARVADALISGTSPSPEQRQRSEQRVLQAGRDYAAGTSTMLPINPTWDNLVLDTLEHGDLAAVDSWTNEWFEEQAGGSSHEVRTWIAAFSALAASGPYRMKSRFYKAIPEWIAGFAVATAEPIGPPAR